MTDEQITQDASVAARYLMALLDQGVERADAVSLTGSYMSSRAFQAASLTQLSNALLRGDRDKRGPRS